MKQAALIVGAGGINAAGRTSGHQSYKRLIFSHLSITDADIVIQDLAIRMGLELLWRENPIGIRQQILSDTLVRDVSKELPWITQHRAHTAALMPRSFDPGKLYPSRNHPKSIKMLVYAMADALASLGFSWEYLYKHVSPDEISVYAGSSIGQIDGASMVGLIQQSMTGKRVSAKLLPFSFPEMPADFINSYILHSIGQTGANLGACASFLYNLQKGVQDIQTGRAKIAIIGGTEAPVEPPLIEGFTAMGALAIADNLPLDTDGRPDHRRACRPFGESMGFVLGESAQILILMSDRLALDLGANILGMVADVFIQADGAKKSITEPGIGNYITMLKASSLAKSLLGDKRADNLYVHAHGTGTPLNCVTESRILQIVATMLDGIPLAITSIKPHVGHSLGTAAGDQIVATLGAWQYGWVPGITTIDQIAEYASTPILDILTEAREIGASNIVIINAKGFGGNNASAVLISPKETLAKLKARYGNRALKNYKSIHARTLQRIYENDTMASQGQELVRYILHDGPEDHQRIHIVDKWIYIDGYPNPISLPEGKELHSYFRLSNS